MQKIMFNDKYGLTDAVLEGEKTCTRRIMSYGDAYRYQVGEIIAISQRYKDLLENGLLVDDGNLTLSNSPGYKNKMFVKSELMPKHIKITGVRMEHLQDISDKDCLREGIIKELDPLENGRPAYDYSFHGSDGEWFDTPREAFALLIDKVSGKGTWDMNPLVAVYDFELVEK